MSKILTKIKCFFGFCEDKIKQEEKIKMEQIFPEPKPKIKTVTVKEEFGKEPIVVEGKGEKVKVYKIPKTPVPPKKEEIGVIIDKKTEVVRVKRQWFNNKKTQKLVPVDEISKLPKSWAKGKLKIKTKGSK